MLKIKQKIFYYNIHKLVNIRSNVHLPFISYFKTYEKTSHVDVSYLRSNSFSFPKPKYWLGNSSFGGDNFVAKDLKFGVRVLMKNVEKDTEVYFSKNAQRIFKYRHVPLNMLIRGLILIKLLQKGWTFLHASSICNKKGEVFAFSGWMETGKTSAINKLLKEGYDFISDDRTLINKKGEVLIFPTPLKVHRTYVPAFMHSVMDTAKEVFLDPTKIKKLKLKKFILLQRASFDDVKKIKLADALRKSTLNYDYEETVANHNLLCQYAYLNPSLNFEKLKKMQQEITNSALNTCEVYEIYAKNRSFLDKIRGLL